MLGLEHSDLNEPADAARVARGIAEGSHVLVVRFKPSGAGDIFARINLDDHVTALWQMRERWCELLELRLTDPAHSLGLGFEFRSLSLCNCHVLLPLFGSADCSAGERQSSRAPGCRTVAT